TTIRGLRDRERAVVERVARERDVLDDTIQQAEDALAQARERQDALTETVRESLRDETEEQDAPTDVHAPAREPRPSRRRRRPPGAASKPSGSGPVWKNAWQRALRELRDEDQDL